MDVPLALLDPEHANMTTEINNPGLMTSVRMARDHYQEKGLKKVSSLFQGAYDGTILHMIPYKRRRSKEISGMFAPLLAVLGIQAKAKQGLMGEQTR